MVSVFTQPDVNTETILHFFIRMRDMTFYLNQKFHAFLLSWKTQKLSYAVAFIYNKNIQRWNEIRKMFSLRFKCYLQLILYASHLASSSRRNFGTRSLNNENSEVAYSTKLSNFLWFLKYETSDTTNGQLFKELEHLVSLEC